MKRVYFIAIFLLIFNFSLFSQSKATNKTNNKNTKTTTNPNQIMTAADFFQKVSDKYASITQYEADVKISANKTEMEGVVSFKKPSMLRMDFSVPEKQVILYNGTELLIYIPKSSAVLRQDTTTDDEQNVATVATPQGLSLMNRYYSIQYENGPQSEPVDPDNPKSKKVKKLVLTRKNNSESFRTMNIAIDPKELLILKITAVTTNDEEFILSFDNYAINADIPDTRFLYDIPPDANEYNNFLYAE